MLGEPVQRTQERIDNGELPFVRRQGEPYIPSAAVLELRQRLLREGTSSPSTSAKQGAEPSQQRPTTGKPAIGERREFSAHTVSEAVEIACSELGVSKEELVYEVRDPGLLHVLGLDSNPATIVVHTSTPHTGKTPNESSSTVGSPEHASDDEDATLEKPPAGFGSEIQTSSSHYYSLGQAAVVLKTSHAKVRSLASQGKLRGERLNGYLWFPSKDFEDFVISEHGSGRLVRAPLPYPTAKVLGPNPLFPGSGGASASARPQEPRPSGENSAAKPKRVSEGPAERRTIPATAAEDRRAVMEAAQRRGTSLNNIRHLVATGQLVYDAESRRLVDNPKPEASEREAGETDANRVEEPTDTSTRRPTNTAEQAPEEYLYIPEAAHELGESVVEILGRIGKRELEAQQLHGKVMVGRRSVMALKEKLDLVPSESSGPRVPETAHREDESQEIVVGLASSVQQQEKETDARDHAEEPSDQPVRQIATDAHIRSIQREIEELRVQLNAEIERRLGSEKTLRDLQAQLEETKAREERILGLLSETKRQLLEEKETGTLEGKDRLLGSIRRLFSQ